MKTMLPRAASPDESARLLDKQWRAKVYIRACPFRKLLNLRWKRYYKEQLKKSEKIVGISFVK